MRRRRAVIQPKSRRQRKDSIFLLLSLLGLSITFLMVFHVITMLDDEPYKKTIRVSLDSLPLTPKERDDYRKIIQKRQQEKNYHNKTEASKGKEPLLKLLQQEAGIKLDQDIIQLLPTWESITNLYGSNPILRDCSNNGNNEAARSLAIAGLFGSGTNLASKYLKRNCRMVSGEQTSIRWEVPGGKHVPRNFLPSSQDVLPVVMIRDPYLWMISLCRIPYGVQWFHNSERHCPNLVPDERDHREFPSLRSKSSIPVHIQYPSVKHLSWDSLFHLWMDWYQQYYDSRTEDRVMIRYEDFVFFPYQTTKYLCEQCAGGQLKHPFTYVQPSAKAMGPGHGEFRTNWITSILRFSYGETYRTDGFTVQDLEFVKTNAQQESSSLMDVFHYPIVYPS